MSRPNTPEGILARLKDKLMIMLNIDFYSLKSIIDRFVKNRFANMPGTKKTHYAKTNLYNEITKDRLSIKVFFKFLQIIEAKKVKITVTVTTKKDVDVTVEEEIMFHHNDLEEIE